MLGLYVHIPFCARRCPYCDFAVVANAKNDFVARYVAALQEELQSTLRNARADECAGRKLTSIFFGGGTPSFLDGEVLAALMKTIRENYPVEENAEISLEANPEDATLEKLKVLREAGWNRISFGAQSFDEKELKFLGRRHDAPTIESSVQNARDAGFENISLDCIYALPGQTHAQWRSTLERVVDLEVPHISCYSLTIEDGTAFGKRAARGVLLPMTGDAQAEMMKSADETLKSAGFERYEISNYAKPGFRSIHNENYWRGGDYLACGNSAHGHLNGKRWWNQSDPKRYAGLIETAGSAVDGVEVLSPRQRLDEIVMLGLRSIDGFDLRQVSEKLQLDARQELNGELQKLAARGVLVIEGERVRLGADAMPIADAVAARLLS
jgi:oxygen-independent coproporphyrinogen-3 oxidase